MALNAKAAALVSIVVEELLYGLSLFMFCATAKILASDALKDRANHFMMIASAALFILSTTVSRSMATFHSLYPMRQKHMTTSVSWVYEGFVLSDDPTSYFDTSASPYVIVKNVAYLLETMLADTVLIYRCYVTWQNIWVILPCSLTAIASTVLTAWVITNVAQAEYWFFGSAERITYAAYALMLVTSVGSTSLLSYKLWTTERSAARYRQGLLGPSIEIILQCGALYSFTLAVNILIKLDYFASYITINMVST